MQIFLMWHKGGEALATADPTAIEARLQTIFAPLFTVPPPSRVLNTAAAAVVSLELPIKGWIPPHFEREMEAWALAPEYPATARTALARRGITVLDGRVLLPLASQLQCDPEPLLRDLAPMFALIWNHGIEEVFLQNDGLGQAQLFEYDDGRIRAISNKIAAFRALGLPLEPVPAEWAVRMTVDWFPGLLTGYRNIRFLAPATQLRLTRGAVERKEFDVLGHWLRRDSTLAPQDCLELAYEGFQSQIRAVAPLWSKAHCGLTGGRDSRAVVSGLLKEGFEGKITFNVRGREKSPEVVIALKLAGKGGIPLRIRTQALRAPGEPDALRRCIVLAHLWQAGYADIRQHESFLNESAGLDGGNVNIMGQHGEIGRGYYATRIQATRLTADRYEDALFKFLIYENTPGATRSHHLVRREHFAYIRETVRQAYRRAAAYGLDGLDRLDFFYLYERTRRWASAGNHIQTGHIFTPFLNPDYIHAVYNYPSAGRSREPFHDFIIGRNRPDWEEIIYEKDIKERQVKRLKRKNRHKSPVNYYYLMAQDWLNQLCRRYAPRLSHGDPQNYWAQAGYPLVVEVLQADGLWRDVFEPDRARKLWFLAPEQLVVTGLLPMCLEDGRL